MKTFSSGIDVSCGIHVAKEWLAHDNRPLDGGNSVFCVFVIVIITWTCPFTHIGCSRTNMGRAK